MKHIKNRFRRIRWDNGNGSMLLCCSILVMGLIMMFLVMEYNNVYTASAIAQTRADTIADSTAVYAMGYDYTFNNRAAYEQAILLTAYNGREDYPISSTLRVLPDSSGANTKLEVTVLARGKFFFPGLTGAEEFDVQRESCVEIVNTSGGAIYIP